MFSKRVINSARFLKMPVSTQALYFHLGLHADDDGIVEAYTVMHSVGACEDDLKVLVAKGFVHVLNEDLVTYITDWNENNKIRADRKIDSIYKDLLIQIIPDVQLLQKKQRADTKKKLIGQPMDNQWTSNGQPMDSIGKDRLGKNRIEKNNINNKSRAEALDSYVIELPTNKFNTQNENYYVTNEFYHDISELYPNVNVMKELKEMKAWLLTNTQKRKTLQGMKKFINSWLSRQQNNNNTYSNENNQQNKKYNTPSGKDGSEYAMFD